MVKVMRTVYTFTLAYESGVSYHHPTTEGFPLIKVPSDQHCKHSLAIQTALESTGCGKLFLVTGQLGSYVFYELLLQVC